MNKDEKREDVLKDLFNRAPREEVPVDFRQKVMQQIYAESVRIKKRNERIGLLSIITASLLIIVLAVASIIYLGLPKIEWASLPSIPFYLYIGALALLLLFGDYKLRESYKKKHSRL
ncbi:MAG: hypothetical protein LBU37_12050 [Tannerellaceae bacterium]|jgi:hypothetical protein|nr:hypothetical protein [Tannerellaceae bacterium]